MDDFRYRCYSEAVHEAARRVGVTQAFMRDCVEAFLGVTAESLALLPPEGRAYRLPILGSFRAVKWKGRRVGALPNSGVPEGERYVRRPTRRSLSFHAGEELRALIRAVDGKEGME